MKIVLQVSGGIGKIIIGQTLFSSITGGVENRINNSCLGFIGGGDYNFIVPTTGPTTVTGSLISGGRANKVHDSLATIAGGFTNTIHAGGERSVISGGNDHNIFAQGAVIGGGVCNTINVGSNVGVIAGGEMNQIVQGGQHSAIGGGINNTITGSCSVIAGGDNNTVNGAYSAILGGNNNSDGGLPNTMIVGNGITAAVSGALHVNNLWMAPATYNTFAGIAPGGTFPNGTIYADTTAGNTLRIQ